MKRNLIEELDNQFKELADAGAQDPFSAIELVRTETRFS
jgi:hypothetical protein